MASRVPGRHFTDTSTPGAGWQRQRERGSQNRSSNVPWKDCASEKPESVDDASRRVFQPYHSMSVPKKRDLEVSYAGNMSMTTVMLRNIPNKYTQGSILQEIDSMGFLGSYNFFYLPMDVHNRTNVGYAFVNFVTPRDMQAFVDLFTEYKFKRFQSQKIARVSPAHIQGFLENVCHFSSCAVTRSRNSQYRPLVMYHGQLRDLAEILHELSASRISGERIAPEVLASLQSGAASSHVGSGLNPDAAEFVPAPSPPQAHWPAPATCSRLDPRAEEFVPQGATRSPILGTAPPAPTVTFQTPLGDSSFSKAKKGLEEAVSMWLRTTDTQSTEGGDSGAGSSHDSPRSGSDKEVSPTRSAVEERHQENISVGALIEAQ